jgi:hypothetical protein
VYSEPLPNRFLASLAPVIKSYISHQEIEKMVIKSFDDFIQHNLLKYKEVYSAPIHFTGSIAFHFKDQLICSLNKHNLIVGNILQQPMKGLIENL